MRHSLGTYPWLVGGHVKRVLWLEHDFFAFVMAVLTCLVLAALTAYMVQTNQQAFHEWVALQSQVELLTGQYDELLLEHQRLNQYDHVYRVARHTLKLQPAQLQQYR